jgi:hypothetical protein
VAQRRATARFSMSQKMLLVRGSAPPLKLAGSGDTSKLQAGSARASGIQSQMSDFAKRK